MTDPVIHRVARARRDAIRAEYAAEEADAAEAEAFENEQAVVSVRVPATLAETLKSRAAAEHIPPQAPTLTVEQVEEIARRVYRESA
jgi:predicted DNA binding CopG/RHH family protein